MEEEVKQYAENLKNTNRKQARGKRNKRQAISLIRYADDFVILHESLDVIKATKAIIEKWLKNKGLELNQNKTKISHTLKEYDGNIGFNFLGFYVRQYPVGKHNSGKSTNGELLGYKTFIKPSKEKVKLHSDKLRKIIRENKTAPQIALITKLNPIIRGWCNYYSTQVSKDTFSTLNTLTYPKLKRWAERRHPKKSKAWVKDKYWHSIKTEATYDKDGKVKTKAKNRNWVFAEKKNGQIISELFQHSDTPIVRHIKVKDIASPFDGDWVYWAKRRGEHPECTKKVSGLIKWQKGKCPHCNLYFTSEDILEIDHIIPTSKGGKDTKENRQLLHRHCHDVKTSLDGSNSRKKKDVPKDKGHSGEKPCEVKVSSTVLKTSRTGDSVA